MIFAPGSASRKGEWVLITSWFPQYRTDSARKSGRHVYGLKGIEELFHVSHKTAQKYKDGILRPAVRQNGRKIITDADYAMELFSKAGDKNER